jgi:hypothetical protein
MRLQIVCFFLLAASLSAQETGSEDLVKSSFPVRLTPEEEAQAQSGNQGPSQQAMPQQRGCCGEPDSNPCNPACCKSASVNCPPLMPRCNPCDCIIDYYNPLIFTGVDASIEILCWKVQQKASTFVLSPHGIHQPFPPSTVADSIGKYQSASFDWSAGVRAGLGYTFERDAWRVMGQYTFYRTSGSDTVKRPTDPTLYLEPTIREVSLSSDGVDAMYSNTHFNYQVADLLISRRFLPGCQVLFNFFTGATGAWIKESWNVKGVDITGSVPNVTNFGKNNWHFNGGGMRAGLDVNWHMGAGFGLFNKLSFAALIGSYYNKRETNLFPEGVDGTLVPNIRNTTEKDTWVVPNTQLEFGLNWNHRFCSWSMMLQGALEISTWYDLHQFHQDSSALSPPNNNRLDIRNASDVKLWGFTASADFGF